MKQYLHPHGTHLAQLNKADDYIKRLIGKQRGSFFHKAVKKGTHSFRTGKLMVEKNSASFK